MTYMIHPQPSQDEESWSKADWNTPTWVLESIRIFAGGYIGLDPCHNPTSTVQAQKVFDKAANSLTKDWTNSGLVFINPPYSRELLMPFAAKIVEEANKGAEVIGLVPTNCETKTWQKYLWKANAICFLNRRVKFLKGGLEQGSPAGGNALVYFGANMGRFVQVFGTDLKMGKVVIPT
jgi:hypothetical protein